MKTKKFFGQKQYYQNLYIILQYVLNVKKTYRVYEKRKKDLINPFYLKCIIPSCQKRENIRKYSILKFAKTIPASIIFNIIQYFIIEKKMLKILKIY